MIRALICSAFFGHDWRSLNLPRYFDEKHDGAIQCMRCHAIKRIRRNKPIEMLRELVAAIDDIETGYTLAKGERLEAALADARGALPFATTGSAPQQAEQGGK